MAAEGYTKVSSGGSVATFGGFAHSAKVTGTSTFDNKMGSLAGIVSKSESDLVGIYGAIQRWE